MANQSEMKSLGRELCTTVLYLFGLIRFQVRLSNPHVLSLLFHLIDSKYLHSSFSTFHSQFHF
jgi:hypothetical protein